MTNNRGVNRNVTSQAALQEALDRCLASPDRDTILVVPYTDSDRAPLLARTGGVFLTVRSLLASMAFQL